MSSCGLCDGPGGSLPGPGHSYHCPRHRARSGVRVEPLQVPAPCSRKGCGDRASWAYFTKAGKLRACCTAHRPK